LSNSLLPSEVLSFITPESFKKTISSSSTPSNLFESLGSLHPFYHAIMFRLKHSQYQCAHIDSRPVYEKNHVISMEKHIQRVNIQTNLRFE